MTLHSNTPAYINTVAWLIDVGEPMGFSGRSLKNVVPGLYCDWPITIEARQ